MLFYSELRCAQLTDSKGSNTQFRAELTGIIDTNGLKKVTRIAYLRSLT